MSNFSPQPSQLCSMVPGKWTLSMCLKEFGLLLDFLPHIWHWCSPFTLDPDNLTVCWWRAFRTVTSLDHPRPLLPFGPPWLLTSASCNAPKTSFLYQLSQVEQNLKCFQFVKVSNLVRKFNKYFGNTAPGPGCPDTAESSDAQLGVLQRSLLVAQTGLQLW